MHYQPETPVIEDLHSASMKFGPTRRQRRSVRERTAYSVKENGNRNRIGTLPALRYEKCDGIACKACARIESVWGNRT